MIALSVIGPSRHKHIIHSGITEIFSKPGGAKKLTIEGTEDYNL